MVYFPFADYWMFYAGFVGFVMVVLALDLGVFHKNAHEVSVKEASIWTAVWIALAMIFNFLFYQYTLWKFTNDPAYSGLAGMVPEVVAKNLGIEFLTGFVVEKSLAIDNIFVFAVVFSFFKIPKKYQHRVLFWGILGALLFRGIFIAMGSILMEYKMVVYFFGALLIVTGIKMVFASKGEKDLADNWLIKFLKKMFRVTTKIEGDKFFVRQNGLLYVTPLFIALIFLELTDILFAVDSVPAIFALTKEPFIVFTSNIFAILGLRSMYFMLSGVMDKFAYIKYGLAAVLVFVGLKMVYLNEAFGGKFPIGWSLGIITGCIGGSVLYSFWVDKRNTKLAA
jgi:tellurite resistance protein TerC